MATITIAGSVCGGKDGGDAVTLKTFDNGNQIATFSVADTEYFYTKKDEERKGQFYRVEVIGKAAEIATDRLVKGSKVAVSGQFVARDYNGSTYYDVKNARVTYLDPRPEQGADQHDEEAPF